MDSDKATTIIVDGMARWVAFVALALAVIVAPWFFGAWEMWWFWPFVAVICVGAVATGFRLILVGPEILYSVSRSTWLVFAALVPFLLYAAFRSMQAEVAMDAERSFLLHLSGVAVAAVTVLGINDRQRRWLFWMLFASLFLMAVYGVINHMAWESRYVLWVPAYVQYAGRATGPYFCPDHFAGAMEFLLCLGFGVMCDRKQRGVLKGLAGLACVAALLGIGMSQSRGSGMTVVVILGVVMLFGVAQWSLAMRWNIRLIIVSLVLLAALSAFEFGGSYIDRFASYDGWRGETHGELWESLKRTCRGRMFGGAIRAWRTAPWLGIGPGMHQHLWPHFAPSADGDGDLGIWPTLVNEDFHSYEVHSDWLQLLEEYGAVGVVLFGFAFVVVLSELVSRMYTIGREEHNPLFASCLAGLLAVIAMGFHSLGDFNLQMPGTVWMLAAIVSIAFGEEAVANLVRGE